MRYSAIDDIIKDWANKHDLDIYTSDRGEEIRAYISDRFDSEGRLAEGVSIFIGGLYKGKVSIWLDHYRTRRSRKRPNKKYPMGEILNEKRIEVAKGDLRDALEKAYEQVNEWM